MRDLILPIAAMAAAISPVPIMKIRWYFEDRAWDKKVTMELDMIEKGIWP